MKMPAPVWETTYSASRRKHHHRCRHCNCIVKDGERVLMARVRSRRTKVLHTECADAASFDGLTARELLTAHGMEYLAGCGYTAARSYLDTSPLFRVGGSATGEVA
jgi:hypothetical protein